MDAENLTSDFCMYELIGLKHCVYVLYKVVYKLCHCVITCHISVK